VSILLLLGAICLAAAAPSAADLYQQGRKEEKAGHMVQAYLLYSEAAAKDPNNQTYWLRSLAVRAQAALQAKLMPKKAGQAAPFVEPTWDKVTHQDYSDLKRLLPPPDLKADSTIKDFDLRGDTRKLYEDVAKAYGLDCVFDADLIPKPGLRFRLRAVGYREALQGLQLATGTFLVPLSEKLFLVAQDTPQKRQQNEPTVSVAIPLHQTLNQQDFNSMVQAVQQTMGIQRVSFDNSTNTVVLRDLYSKVLPAEALVNQLLHPQAQVMVEMKMIQVSENNLVTYGLDLPTMFSLTPLTTWLQNQIQVPSGISGLITFGGGKSLLGIGIMNASLVAQMTKGTSTTLLDTQLRSLNAQAASMHIGDRYPVVSSEYVNSTIYGGSSGSGAPKITTDPQSQTVTAGQTVTFSVAATGTPPLTYQWMEGGNIIASATSSTYTTPATTLADSGLVFSVLVSNTTGTAVSQPAILTVTSIAGAPAIATQPENQTVSLGDTATFGVTVTGTKPLAYQWLKNGIPIPGATLSNFTTPQTVLSNNGATFSVVVTNAVGTVTSKPATLTVSTVTGAPSITTQPQSQTVTTGQIATFTVNALGTTPFTYQWTQNGTLIDGATSRSYTTPATTLAYSGTTYAVTVSNAVGMATSASATLTVTGAEGSPAITIQPQSQTANLGETATFSVDATGNDPLTYQWYVDGNPIAGATSSYYTTGKITADDNGKTYSVTVSNAVGNVTSDGARLTVNTSPLTNSGLSPLATMPSFQYVDLGLSLKVTPFVHDAKEVSLDVDAQFQLLGGASAGGLPVITNRSIKSTVRVEFGQWAVVSGLLNPTDARTVAGLAGLSRVPYLGELMSKHTRNRTNDQILLLIRPYLITAPAGSEFVTKPLRVGSETKPFTPL
jgi:Flp pilus assembly secretin CpaC